ncbi:unnamed protein product [Discula destructiva]
MDPKPARSGSVSEETDVPPGLDLKRSSAGYASPPPSAGLARTPTLSWQRRPPSQGPGPRSRPLSMVAAENAARSSTPTAEATSPDHAPSRDQIAQALAAKDPGYFRQTADRGASSAAYRKNHVEDGDTVDVLSRQAQLPGMSRPTSTELRQEAARERRASLINSRSGSPRLPMHEGFKLDPSAEMEMDKDATAAGPPSPTRPASPTKGMGGFVQSAMMKRTDSVKRWSVNTPGLHRGNPLVNRNSYEHSGDNPSPGPETTSRPVSRSRDSVSRPSSSHGKEVSSAAENATQHEKPVSPTIEIPQSSNISEEALPLSPSKTMDPRRWSPTKGASWLDKALKQPESPKPRLSPVASNQPAWMVELNKAKAERAKNPSMDLGRAGSTVKKHEVKTGGLVRPAPMGTVVKPSILNGPKSPALPIEKPLTPVLRSAGFSKSPAPERLSSPSIDEPRRGSVASIVTTPINEEKPDTPTRNDFRTSLRARGTTLGNADKGEALKELSDDNPDLPPKNDFRKSLRARGTTLGNADKVGAFNEFSEDKPELPVKDLRTSLRARGTTLGNTQKGESVNELANVFGKLRQAKTQNYVAPDELKDNILRGKSGLNTTGGPRPYVKKDEFKDAILQRKAEFNQAKEEGRAVATNAKPPEEKPIPEALARRATISRVRSSTLHSRNSSTVASMSEFSGKAPESPATLESPASRSRHVSEESAAPKPENTEPASVTEPPAEKSVPGRLPNKIGGGALANRFNPALAGILARGPPGAAPKFSGISLGPDAGNEPGPGPQLTHLTKNRARGPPKRAPAKASASKSPGPGNAAVADTTPLSPVPDPEEFKTKDVGEKSISPIQPVIAAGEAKTEPKLDLKIDSKLTSKTSTSSLTQPQTPNKSPREHLENAMAERFAKSELLEGPTGEAQLRSYGIIPLVDSSKVRHAEQEPTSTGASNASVDSPKPKVAPGSPSKIHEQVAALAALAQPAEEKKAADQPLSSPSPRKLNVKRMSRFLDEPSQTAPKAEADVTPSPSPVKKTFGALPSPRKPSDSEKVDAQPTVSVKNGAAIFGRSLTNVKPQVQETHPTPAEKQVEKPVTKPVERVIENPNAKPVEAVVGRSAGKAAAKPFEDIATKSVEQRAERVTEKPVLKPAAKFTEEPVLRSAEKPIEKPVERPVPAPLDLRPRSPNKVVPIRTPAVGPTTVATASPAASPTRSPSKSGADISAMLKDFFGSERPKREYHIDTGAILESRAKENPKIKTTQSQLFQITEQGKRVPVRSHYERVLFEREMYLCVHTFSNGGWRKVSELYFWVGDEVPPAVVEDAQIFVNREAKLLGGTLIRIHQGKEPAEFIQALGGIAIIRRGSSNKYDSLASNMLCGRQYHGQIVFDEVDFNPQTLCSGFPYVITQSGICYLWKGKGAGVDELSCARLIGMDSALMGDLVEIEEGEEPESFWDLFNGAMKMSSADHWRLKPTYDKYCGRLFCSDTADPRQVRCVQCTSESLRGVLTTSQIVELYPFSQSDLSPNKVYVLDAFFEMYIIVGRYAQNQYASFHNALDFAQEYAILAAGMEDRPFVPVSTVVLEGIPRDLRSCFRKWRDELSPTRMVTPSSSAPQQRSPLKRARSLKVIQLGQALQALSGSQ